MSGDSGNPLISYVRYQGKERSVQMGIVSAGHSECGTNGIPGIYTDVNYYLEWILNNIAE